MSNRVEDLERQVAELQAAVNGLTEELVEMKERVRQVEDAQEVAVEAEAATEPAEPEKAATPDESTEATGGERRTHSDDHVEVVEQTGDSQTTDSAEASDGDDVVVPEESATTPDAEAAKSDEAESDDEESDNDIIVA